MTGSTHIGWGKCHHTVSVWPFRRCRIKREFRDRRFLRAREDRIERRAFWDNDGDASTDALLMAWLNPDSLWEVRRDVADLPTGKAESLSMAEFFWSFDEVVAPLSPVPLPYSAPPLGRGLRADGSHRPPSETRDRLTLSAHKKKPHGHHWGRAGSFW